MSSPQSRHDPYVALRHRDFRLLLAASMLSTIGAEMQGVAVGWELYERTGSALALGWVGLVQAIPVIALALPAGHVADRFPRRDFVMASRVLMGLASLGLAATSYAAGPLWLTYACLFATGVAAAFGFPAIWALLPELVPGKDFHNAVTWRSTGWQVAAVAGPGLGGAVLALGRGATPAYLADAFLSLVAFALLGSLRVPAGTPRPQDPFTWDSLLAGVRYVWRTDLILATITLDMFAVLLGGATTLLPIFAKDILVVGPAGLGLLRAAPSIGACTMAMAIAHRPPFRSAGRALLIAVAGFGAATIGFGLSRNYFVSLAMLCLTGAFDNISVVIRATLLQALTPDAMRGRVSAVNSVFIGMSNELGGFESGVAARLLGPVTAVVAGGVGCLLVVLGVGLKWPSIVRLGSIASATDGLDLVATMPTTPLDVEGHT